jgi:hypothetical protein
VKELTSAYEDIEKRMGIYTGLGAFLFSSLICLLTNAELESYLVRGVLALLVFGLAGWWYGSLLRRLLTPPEEASPKGEDTTITMHDVKPLAPFEVPKTDGAAGLAPEEAAAQTVDYNFNEFPPEEAAPQTPPPQVETAAK